MSITPITQELSNYTTTPIRGQSEPDLFSGLMDTRITEQDTNVTETNTLVGQMNVLAGEVNTLASQAQTNADSAAASASAAAASANNNGAWSNLTGAFPIGEAVNHNGEVWISNVAIADVTLSEPSDSNSDWTKASSIGGSWEAVQTSSFTLESSKKYAIDASGGAVDAALPSSINAGDAFTVHNNSNSTNTARVTNASYTVRGSAATLSAGDNIVLDAGDTVNLVAITASILEVV